MEYAERYVAAIQEFRAHERGQRHLRQKRRHEYLNNLQEEMDLSSRAALHYSVQAPAISSRSQVEKCLVEFSRKTRGLWREMCDQSIDQQLRYEQSLVDQVAHRLEYFENVHQRENREYQAVCNSDQRRWQQVSEEFVLYERQLESETVSSCKNSILQSLDKCIELMNDYCIDRSKENLLAQFALRRVTHAAYLSKTPEHQQEDAFRHIFGKNAYGITGIPFKQLIDFAFQRCDVDKRATYEFDACSVPLFVVEGPKLSGKSLLANELMKKFKLHRFSDRSLVQLALLRASFPPKKELIEEGDGIHTLSGERKKLLCISDRTENTKGEMPPSNEEIERNSNEEGSVDGNRFSHVSHHTTSRHLSQDDGKRFPPPSKPSLPTTILNPTEEIVASQIESEAKFANPIPSSFRPSILGIDGGSSQRPRQRSTRKSASGVGGTATLFSEGALSTTMNEPNGNSRRQSATNPGMGLTKESSLSGRPSQDSTAGVLLQQEQQGGQQLMASSEEVGTSSLAPSSSMESGRSTEWMKLGNVIRETLYRGEAIDQSITAQLLRLLLKELKATEDCRGAIFEGVLNRVVELPELLHSLIPQRSNQFEELRRLWCEGLEEHLREQECKQLEEAERDSLSRPSISPAFSESDELVSRSQLSRHRKSRAARASSCVPKAIEPPPADVPSILAVLRVELEEPAKREGRAKSGKRGVDLSQLPPPVLPKVEDITEKVVDEEAFIQTCLDQLQHYTGLFSSILYIKCSPEEIFKRFAGLRIDSETSKQYHLLYNPPPKERMPFLVGCDRTLSFSSELYDVVFRQKEEWKNILEWALRHSSLRNRVHELDGDQTLESIEAQASPLVEQALEHFNVGKELYDAMGAARNRLDELKSRNAQQVLERETERQRLAALYTEKGVPLPPELEPKAKSGQWCSTPDEVLEMILNALKVFHAAYGQTYNAAWKEFSSLSFMILEYRRFARSQLAKLWRQPDDKQGMIDRFLRQFNTVPRHLRSKIVCKEELHLCAEELGSNLFASVELKKKDAAALIDHVVRHDVYLDGWEASVCNLGALLMQQEAERFTLVMNLSVLYFSSSQEEPVMFEEVDTDVNLIRTFEAATGDLAAAAGGAGRNKADKKSASGSGRKGHGRANDESGGDSSILEALFETGQRLCNAISALCDKFKQKALSDASGRGQKKVTLRSLRLSSITASCLPFLESEQAAALERINCVKRFVSDLARQGDSYMQSIKAEMMGEARFMLHRQASAVNSALYYIRSAIESEDEAPSMHLGCGTFALVPRKKNDEMPSTSSFVGLSSFACFPTYLAPSQGTPSFLTDVPLYAIAAEYSLVPIHDSLSAGRLFDIIARFQCSAPQYQLCRDTFVSTIQVEDYGATTKDGEYVLDPVEVFSRFDPLNTGVMDWREMIMHLLFWCCTPERKKSNASCHLAGVAGDPLNNTLTLSSATRHLSIPEATMDELLSMKKYLFSCGKSGVTEDQFRECPFPFDSYLQADRREVYIRALWLTFANATSKLLDPFALMCFFCIDLQPVRGAQKAFTVLSDFARGAKISRAGLERILHIRATNPRAVALIDPFSKVHLSLLLGPKKIAISLKEMCNCAIGRHMLNQFDFMKRKRFVFSV